jgi:hypothetical protein
MSALAEWLDANEYEPQVAANAFALWRLSIVSATRIAGQPVERGPPFGVAAPEAFWKPDCCHSRLLL